MKPPTGFEVLLGLLERTPGPETNATRLVALLILSNNAEDERDPFQRRLRLNELQAAIQAIRPEIEALAEGMMFLED